MSPSYHELTDDSDYSLPQACRDARYDYLLPCGGKALWPWCRQAELQGNG